MKGDTPLDCAEFQLTHSRTRCELYISANGKCEKLASGSLKPFIAHLRAVEMQVARGNPVIRLEWHPNSLKHTGDTWFTKGTLERFVRFVSTPEVLERVRIIEDELSQLEQVRSTLAKTFSQSVEQFPTVDTVLSPTGSYHGRDVRSMMTRRNLVDADENGAEASKRELLRAMDVRLIALRQEQSLAFSRAVAAGFDSSKMTNLMAFSEHFGAERLGAACVQFIMISRKRQTSHATVEVLELPSDEIGSSGSDMSLASGNEVNSAEEEPEPVSPRSRNSVTWPNKHEGNSPYARMNIDKGDQKVTPQETSASNIGSRTRGSMDTRKRWGPPERLQINYLESEVSTLAELGETEEPERGSRPHPHADSVQDRDAAVNTPQDGKQYLSKGHNQGDYVSAPAGKGGMFFAQLQKMAQQVEARKSAGDSDGKVHFTSVGMSNDLPRVSSTSSLSPKPLRNFPGVSNTLISQAPGDDDINEHHILKQSSTSPERRASSSTQRPQEHSSLLIHPTLVSSQNSDQSDSQDGSSVSKERLEKARQNDSTDSQVSKVSDNQEGNSSRRLSVQAAISLFESKKVSPTEANTKKLVKQESQKSLTENGNSSAAGKAVLRRWSAIGLPVSSDSGGHENVASPQSKEEVKSVDKCSSTKQEKDSSTTNKSTSEIQDQPVTENKAPQRQETSSTVCLQLNNSKQPKPLVANPSSMPPGDFQKQFKAELEKSLARGPRNTKEVQSEVDSAKFVMPTAKGSSKNVKADVQGKDFLTSSGKAVDTTGKMQEEIGNWNDQSTKQVPADTSVSNRPLVGNSTSQKQGNNDSDTSASKPEPIVKTDMVKAEKKVDDNNQSATSAGPREFPTPIEQTNAKEPSNGWDASVDFHMQALVRIIDNHDPAFCDQEFLHEQKGRLYEHYRRLRDDRLRAVHPAKKAEKEAKLKALKDTLEKRKAELAARAHRESMNNRSWLSKEQIKVGQAQRSGLSIAQGEQDEQGDDNAWMEQDGRRLQMQEQLYDCPSSPASKTYVSGQKPESAKKTVPTLQKCVTAPRSTMRSAAISSPRTTSKNTLVGILGQRKSGTTSPAIASDNSVSRSVSNVAEWKKETSKLNSGRPASSARIYPKANGNLRPVSNNTPLAENDNSIESGILPAAGQEEERQQQRKSYSSAVDRAGIPSQGALSESHTAQDQKFVESLSETWKRTPISSNKEANYFTHDGRNQNISAFPDGFGCSDEKVSSDSIMSREMTGSDHTGRREACELEGSMESQRIDGLHGSLECEENLRPAFSKVYSTSGDRSPNEGDLQDGLFETSFSVPQYSFAGLSSSGPKSGTVSVPLSQLVAHRTNESSERRISVGASAASFQETSLAQQRVVVPFSLAAVSSTNSSTQTGIFSGRFSPHAATPLESPSDSPASWNSSQACFNGESDLLRGQRLFGGSQKSNSTAKEPAKGFKRLLHFGRKSRASETIAMDCVSASTTSEGDDDAEDVVRQSCDDSLTKTRLVERGFDAGDQYLFQDHGAVNSVRSSIPAPPANFKLREDHLSGSTLLKAPRSFFSLSSFRSKNTEGKSR